eukprot:TRINITY_DN37072_c0_g1_i1.p1 TRINITY_DN37072_c0_g1~~TRINITY_DN37072_c0_g1_i1.p1  ORF type:complete len:381 (+),score=136.08 TRINITY_DN37072_c0_g1_i1:60-1145(+)
MLTASAPRHNPLNTTTPVGQPTAQWRELTGKYQRLLAEGSRAAVERWYNLAAVPSQRRTFRHLLREVSGLAEASPAAPADARRRAEALLKVHGGGYIAERWRQHAVTFLAFAAPADLQAWRETFGAIDPLSLFTGASSYRTDFGAERVRCTAEHVRRQRDEGAKRRFHAEKLARIRGLPPPAGTPTASRSSPRSSAGSTALLASSVAEATPRKRRGDGSVQMSPRGTAKVRADKAAGKVPGRNTTYEGFFAGSPYKDAQRRRWQQELQEQRAASAGAKANLYHRSGGVPWGKFEPLRDQAYVTHNEEFFLNHGDVDGARFRNYNENVEAELARRWRREQRMRLRQMLREKELELAREDGGG